MSETNLHIIPDETAPASGQPKPASKEMQADLLKQVGRIIDKAAGTPIEIEGKRSRSDIFENRPGPYLREKS